MRDHRTEPALPKDDVWEDPNLVEAAASLSDHLGRFFPITVECATFEVSCFEEASFSGNVCKGNSEKDWTEEDPFEPSICCNINEPFYPRDPFPGQGVRGGLHQAIDWSRLF